jgi:hypothetical protein
MSDASARITSKIRLEKPHVLRQLKELQEEICTTSVGEVTRVLIEPLAARWQWLVAKKEGHFLPHGISNEGIILSMDVSS